MKIARGLQAPDIAPLTTLERLERLYDRPWSLDDRGVVVSINPRWWAGLYHTENHVLHCPVEGFFEFDALEGIYVRLSPERLREHLASLILRIAREHSLPGLVRQAKVATLSQIALFLEGISEVRDPFDNTKGILAVQNGVLVFARGKVRFEAFSPKFRVRDRIPVVYDRHAVCPRYDQEFMADVLEDDDVDLLHRQTGLILAGINPSHRLGILEGVAGSGKSSYLKLVTEMNGVSRVVELRTTHLDKPFELSAFRGKTLLTASDVGADFLSTAGAHTLKGLVSDDLFNPESKNSNERKPMRGPFSVLIGTNCKLVYRSQGDADAWRRRLIIYEWKTPPAGRRKVIDFVSQLLASEGPGILNRWITGYKRAWGELQEFGDLVLSEVQQARVEALVMRSEALEMFVKTRIEADPGEDLTSQEFLEAFLEWCLAMGWIPPSERIIQIRAPELMLQHHGKPRSNNLQREGHKYLRGWRGVRLIDDGARAFPQN
jgi:phage/plasmid-associated DNA primase